ncbi:hypothetical protein ZIOFF_074178 [Zingiber officinale]|uniref:Reverse transcriptase Ty1/copia-type domain-containing protein n=1 Tax=Zingiber officinale TaxID=94328 RepID=A0A8J5C051_ZINOF|nr:hypothetical protein ZIOFF_074178 [Zingiber officinale]
MKQSLMQMFKMTDLGEMTFFLGMEVNQIPGEIFIYQKKYVREILKRFRMEECKSVATPMTQKDKLSKSDGSAPADNAFYIRSACFSWCSKKQEIVAQSTAEAEFVAATSVVNQAIWLRKLLNDMSYIMEKETKVSVDNQAALAISKNPVFHGKTKHFNVKYYYLREVQQIGEVELIYCTTEDQLADIFTKSFHQSRFVWLREKIGVSISV